MMSEFYPGEPVRYKHRLYTVVRYLPGHPKHVIIVNDEGEELRVPVSSLYPA